MCCSACHAIDTPFWRGSSRSRGGIRCEHSGRARRVCMSWGRCAELRQFCVRCRGEHDGTSGNGGAADRRLGASKWSRHSKAGSAGNAGSSQRSRTGRHRREDFGHLPSAGRADVEGSGTTGFATVLTTWSTCRLFQTEGPRQRGTLNPDGHVLLPPPSSSFLQHGDPVGPRAPS